ncbi:GDSL-type esterase/lipase family protein [Paenibacillus glycanilyticus]|uniref:GDSL-type esterase/lipase family protein n=1 Tax=Paenibacillus glycanilyticus TaxID=126569 RepID=UPI003EB8DD47
MKTALLELHNFAEQIEHDGKWVWSRVPNAVRLELNALAQQTSFCMSGSEVRFRMQSDEVTIRFKLANELQPGAALAEIFHGCFPEPEPDVFLGINPELRIRKPEKLSLMRAIAEQEDACFNPELVRILLPINANIAEIELVQGAIAAPLPEDKPSLRWLAYGSSITHGASAGLPSSTYAMKTASSLGVDLINLGFPGSALLDDAAAAYIASRTDWDFATLELGINVKWDVAHNKPVPVSVFEDKLERFLPHIANAHKDKWIFCIDMFAMQGDFDGDPLVYPYREAVKKRVKQLNLPRLIHLDGLELLSQGTGLASDLIHPSNSGMEKISHKLAEVILAHMSPSKV